MVRMLSILFAGWVVNRVMVENRIRHPIALLPPPGRKRQEHRAEKWMPVFGKNDAKTKD